jgi:hypothetical protein
MSNDHQRTQQITLHPTCALHTQDLTRIATTVDDIHRRLFVDNGKPCHQTRLDRLDSFRGLFIWFGGIVITALVGITLTLVLK